MALRTPDTKEEQDQAHNLSQEHYDKKFNEIVAGDLQQRENESIPGYDRSNDGLDDHPISAGDASGQPESADNDPGGNIKSANEKERNASNSPMNYTGNGGQKNIKAPVTAKDWVKKKGPMGLLIAALFGGGGLLTVLFSPGIAIVQLKETLVGDLNDQASAMDLRSDRILRGKLTKLQGNVSLCTNTVSIRCKFGTMGSRQSKKFINAGFKIEPSEPDKVLGRTKVTAIIFPDGTRVTNPTEMRNHIRGNPQALSDIRKAFNPRFAGFFDAVSNKVFLRFNTDKTKKVTGSTDEERDKSVTNATSGKAAGVSAEGYRTEQDGRKYVLDEKGNKIYENTDPDKFNEIASKNKEKLSDIANQAKKATPKFKAVSNFFSSAGKGLLLTGKLDTACTIYNTGRAAAAAAKASRALQLVQFAMVFFVTADRIKAGVATPEEVSYLGDNIMTVDNRKTVVDENSTWAGSGASATANAHENPDYGKNGFDSAGYKTAAYNEAPILSARDLQYAVGGGLVGGLSKVMDEVAKILGGRNNIRKTCSVVQSWWARTAGLIAGVASAVGSFGASTVITIGGSVAIGFAMPFLEAALADIIAGTVTSSATKGIDAGDATFAGAGALLGGMAMARGMKPAKSSEIKSYIGATEEIKNDVIAADMYDARKTPFDITNQYSFLGSMIRSINPTITKSTASVSGAFVSIPTIISTGFSSIIPKAKAAIEYNPDRYKRCSNDEGYRELGIDADVFCNVRYIMSDKQLNMDPDEAAAWMISHGHIEEDGTPKSDAYKTWISSCTERQDGWGETSSDDNISDADIGKICMEVNDQLDHFAVFTMDKGIQDAMDSDLSNGGTSVEEPAAFFYDPHNDIVATQNTPTPTQNNKTTSEKQSQPTQFLIDIFSHSGSIYNGEAILKTYSFLWV